MQGMMRMGNNCPRCNCDNTSISIHCFNCGKRLHPIFPGGRFIGPLVDKYRQEMSNPPLLPTVIDKGVLATVRQEFHLHAMMPKITPSNKMIFETITIEWMDGPIVHEIWVNPFWNERPHDPILRKHRKFNNEDMAKFMKYEQLDRVALRKTFMKLYKRYKNVYDETSWVDELATFWR